MINTDKLDWQLREITYAATALMLAVAKADFDEDPNEESVIVNTIKSIFTIDDEVLQGLMTYAHARTDSSQLTEFTDLVNQHYDAQDKLALIDCLWQVALADGRIDLYEDQFISRVASLISVDKSAVQSSKDRASGTQ